MEDMKQYLLELIDNDILHLTQSRDINTSWANVTHPDRKQEYLDLAEWQTKRLSEIKEYRQRVEYIF